MNDKAVPEALAFGSILSGIEYGIQPVRVLAHVIAGVVANYVGGTGFREDEGRRVVRGKLLECFVRGRILGKGAGKGTHGEPCV